MKQGTLNLFIIGLVALVISLFSSRKIVQNQTVRAKRQALSIKRTQKKPQTQKKTQKDLKRFRLQTNRSGQR